MRRSLLIGALLCAVGCDVAEEEEPAAEGPPSCAEGEWRLKGSINGIDVDEAHAITPPHRLLNVEGSTAGSLELEGVDGYLHARFDDRLTPSGSVPASIEIRVTVPSPTWISDCVAASEPGASTLGLDADSGGGTFTVRGMRSKEGEASCGDALEGELKGCYRFP